MCRTFLVSFLDVTWEPACIKAMNCNTPSGTCTHTGVCLPVWDSSDRCLHPGSQVRFAPPLSSCLHTLTKNLQLCFNLDSQKCFSILKPQILIWPGVKVPKRFKQLLKLLKVRGHCGFSIPSPLTPVQKWSCYSVSPFQTFASLSKMFFRCVHIVVWINTLFCFS